MKILAKTFHEKSSIIRNKYYDLYHLSEKIEYLYKDFYVTEWSLYKKYKNLDLYLSNQNKPLLSSKNGNTLDDLNNLINRLENKRINRYKNLV